MNQQTNPSPVRSDLSSIRRTRDFRARMADIAEVMGFLTTAFDDSTAENPDEAMLFDLRLTVTEAFANIVEHSYGNEPDQVIRVGVEITSEWLEILFEDFGRRPDPQRLRWRDLGDYRERGLGLFLMSKCMDDVSFTFRADGMNRLRTRRFFARRDHSRRTVHLPFHLAVYETADEIDVYPIGHLEQSRGDPFHLFSPPNGVATVLDLSGLDFVDAWGLERIVHCLERVRAAGLAPNVVRPPEHLLPLFMASGFLPRIAPSGWFERSTARGELVGRAPGRYLPLFRAFGSHFFPAASAVLPADAGLPETFLRRLVPERFTAAALRGEAVVRWGRQSRCLFFRPLPAIPDGDASILFIGGFARPGLRALIGAAQLYAALGAFPEFARRRKGASLHEFIRLLSSGMRDLLPSATTDPDGDTPLLLVLEFAAEGLRAVTGVGAVLASVDGVELRGITLAASENAITETRNLRFFDVRDSVPRVRLHLGRATSLAAEREKMALEEIRAASHAGPILEEDEGVLDVFVDRTYGGGDDAGGRCP